MAKRIISTISGITKAIVKGKGWTPVHEIRKSDLVKTRAGWEKGVSNGKSN